MLDRDALDAVVVASPGRDWLDYVSAFSGLAGILIALVALGYSIWQANQTKLEAIQERRNEFELGLLAEIRRQMAVTGFQHLAGYVGALVVDPENETDIPMTRAKIGVKSTAEGKRKLAALKERAKDSSLSPELALIVEIEGEIDAAIQSRLEKDGSVKRQIYRRERKGRGGTTQLDDAHRAPHGAVRQ